jgi:hypothetical protein
VRVITNLLQLLDEGLSLYPIVGVPPQLSLAVADPVALGSVTAEVHCK